MPKALKPAKSSAITIPLSPHQQQRLAVMQQEFEAQSRLNNQRLSDTVTAMIASEIDPASVQGWDIRQDGANIVCTPPKEKGPELVKDIGPDGVSEAAATS